MRQIPLFATIAVCAACSRDAPNPAASSASAPALRAAAVAHYEAYGRAVAAPHRRAMAGFYHPDGALRVFNGDALHQSQAELTRMYESEWSPPAFFEWERLSFDSIAPGQVLVTGGFRWVAAGARDTAQYIYAGMLVSADSGVRIIFEHETLRPKP